MDFQDGKPHSIEAFGTKLVVFADSKGDIKILDAYCRHMGGDLSQGTIKGDSIACPFHDWRWGGNGKCTDIPYARRVPPLAQDSRLDDPRAGRLLFVWHDPEGNPPPAEVTIPVIEGARRRVDRLGLEADRLDTNCREIVDNVVDMAHFFYVHYSFPTYFKNIFEGHAATQDRSGVGRDDIADRTDPDVPEAAGNTVRRRRTTDRPS